jgi:hypothetical protein
MPFEQIGDGLVNVVKHTVAFGTSFTRMGSLVQIQYRPLNTVERQIICQMYIRKLVSPESRIIFTPQSRNESLPN